MNVGIVGLGRMGMRHVEVCRQLGLNVSVAYDQAPAAAKRAAESFGSSSPTHIARSIPELLGTRIDGLIVATTAPSHADLTIAAAESGVDFVLCEKPMATSLFDCERMISACDRAGTKLAINHQMRFMEQYLKVKDIAQSPNFGGLRSVNVTAGNFGMSMNGVHYFELFRWLTDEQVSGVTAWFSKESVPNPRGAHFEDKAGSIRLEVPSGRRFYMEIGADQGHGVHVTYAGRTGMIVSDELNGIIRVSTRNSDDLHLPTTFYGRPSELEEIPVAPADVIEPSARVLEALIAGTDYPSGKEGRDAMAVLVAAHVSDETGHATVSPSDISGVDKVLPIA